MSSIDLLSHLKTTGKQPAKPLIPIIKNTLKPPSAAAVPAQEESVFLFSQEAKKIIEEKKEAEKQKVKEAMDKIKEKSIALKELEKNSNQNNRAKKIAEIKARLKELLERIHQVLLFGDKRAASQIAKEAAQLAKELKSLGGAGGGGENVSVPDIDLSGESAESGAPIEGVGENINGEEMSAEAEAEAAAQAQEALSDAGEAEEAGEGKEGGQSEQTENAEGERKVNVTANELQAMARNLVSKHENGFKNDAAERLEFDKIKAMLRAIVSMAKQTIGQRTGMVNNGPENPRDESNLETEVARSEAEIEEAIKEASK